jgi:hypothetical protein
MMAETAVDATNWEEALRYYNKALEKDIANYDAWLGKGIAMVYTSKIGDIKTKEAIAYWKNAIKYADNADAMSKRVAKEINTVVIGFYPSIENHYIEFSGLDNSYQELVSRFATLENAQDYATQLDGENISYQETGFALCKRVIDLPKKYASAAHSSALAEGIVGQFTSNEYSRKYAAQDARGKMNKANERKKEIEKAAIIILQIQNKYIELIAKIYPNNPLVLEKRKNDEIEVKIQKEIAHGKEYGHFYFFGLIGGAIVGAFIAVPISYIVEIPKGVLMSLSVILFIVLGLFSADKIVKGKAK